MDIGQIPELTMHFMAVSQVMSPLIAHSLHEVSPILGHIWLGATDPKAMCTTDRHMQYAKMGSAGFGLVMSVIGRSPHGTVACTVALADGVLRLARAGADLCKPKEP